MAISCWGVGLLASQHAKCRTAVTWHTVSAAALAHDAVVCQHWAGDVRTEGRRQSAHDMPHSIHHSRSSSLELVHHAHNGTLATTCMAFEVADDCDKGVMRVKRARKSTPGAGAHW